MSFRPDSLELPESTFVILRDLIHEKTGLYYELGKRDLLADKLYPRIVEWNFDSFLDYYYLLKYDEKEADEWNSLMDALAVSETFFGREFDQVHALVNVLLPQCVGGGAGGRSRACSGGIARPIQIWSAACSSGEEPISIAIALQEAGWFHRVPIRIYGSDASPRAIAKAQTGLYREYSFRSLSPELRHKYFVRDGQNWRIIPEIHDRIRWKVANLRSESDLTFIDCANFIFCRNVFIYFSDSSIQKTAKTLFQKLSTPGYLFLSSSESLLQLETDFKLLEIDGAFLYAKSS
ncbi:MAG: CheR family methyltransferase [Limnospira sp.]